MRCIHFSSLAAQPSARQSPARIYLTKSYPSYRNRFPVSRLDQPYSVQSKWRQASTPPERIRSYTVGTRVLADNQGFKVPPLGRGAEWVLQLNYPRAPQPTPRSEELSKIPLSCGKRPHVMSLVKFWNEFISGNTNEYCFSQLKRAA